MSTRDLLSRVAARVVERTWGEAVLLTPRLVSDYGTSPVDPARPATVVRAIVSVEQKDGDLQGGRRGTQMQGTTYISMERVHLYLRPETIEGLGYEVKKGDFVTLSERPAPNTYLVEHIAELDGGETQINLNRTNTSAP